MKTVFPSFYKSFKCLADKCSLSCCKGWQIVIDEKTESKYKALSGELADRIKSSILNDGECSYFDSNENGCIFLNENMLCDIQSAFGEEMLCNTCRLFPRIITEYGAYREISMSASCPETAEKIIENGFELFEEESNELPKLNSIDAELFYKTLKKRNEILKFPSHFFKPINPNKVKELFSNLEMLDEGFVNEKLKLINSDCLAENNFTESVFRYFIFRYYLASVLEDYSEEQALKFANICTNAAFQICVTDKSPADAFCRFSREIEHSQNNVDAIMNCNDLLLGK